MHIDVSCIFMCYESEWIISVIVRRVVSFTRQCLKLYQFAFPLGTDEVLDCTDPSLKECNKNLYMVDSPLVKRMDIEKYYIICYSIFSP